MFSVFAFCALILIVAVFAAVAGKTLADTPEVVIPTFGLVVVALIVGFLMYKLKLSVSISSVIGILFLGGLIWLGYKFPLELPFQNSVKWWTGILLLYGLIASVTPVTVLLQPRDHLAAFVLFVGLGFGFLGVIISHPEIKAPAFIAFKDSGKGWLWPMLFVTIACGAISGFHSLVASGTTSKQLPAMRDARKVGYGAMVLESALSVLAVICVTAGLYWKQVPSGEEGFVYQEVFSEGGWIKAFGRGYGTVTKSLFGGFGFLIGITMLKTFIMTTLDSATRITRYMVNELFGEAMGIKFLENKYTATLLVGVLSGALALGNWQAIWPVFGAANQLIASLVLLVVTVYLIKGGKPSVFTLIPGILIFLTTFGAMFYNIKKFLGAENPSVLLIILSFVLIVVAFFMLVKAVFSIREALNR